MIKKRNLTSIRRQLSKGLLVVAVVIGTAFGLTNVMPAEAKELKLSFFMSPKHPMNKAVFKRFANDLKQVSGGKLTVKLFPGGTLNAAPPQQYSRLLEGVADISFGLPGYTGQLFPVTNTITVPGLAKNSIDGTKRLIRARVLIEAEYDAKVLAVWANETKVLITKSKPVHRLEDVNGMTIRVTSAQDVPYIEALGASAVAQPVNVIHQNLTNGTIDAIHIGSSAIGSFKLWEPANYITVNMPPSVSAFFLLMNKDVWHGLSMKEKGWVDQASGPNLWLAGGKGYDAAGKRGLKIAAGKGVKLITLPDTEVKRFQDAMTPAIETYKNTSLRPGLTGGQVIEAMGGLDN